MGHQYSQLRGVCDSNCLGSEIAWFYGQIKKGKGNWYLVGIHNVTGTLLTGTSSYFVITVIVGVIVELVSPN